MKKALLLLALLSAALLPARAHYLWIEGAGEGGAMLRFGHYEEGLRETGAGLDKIPGPKAWTGEGKDAKGATATVARIADGFAVSFKKGRPATVWAGEEAVAVFPPAKPGDPALRGIGYARWIADRSAAVAPEQELDIVPVGADRNAFAVFLHGKPLPKAAVEVHAPNLWNRTYLADDAGVVRIETPFPGFYVLETSVKEETPGTLGGVPYGRVRYGATLSFDAP